MTTKFDMYSRKTSIDSGLIEKCIFINVREYSLLSSAPINSARCNLRFCIFFCFEFHSKNTTITLCSEENNISSVASFSFNRQWIISWKLESVKNCTGILEEKFYVHGCINSFVKFLQDIECTRSCAWNYLFLSA